ncbi:FadR/GntR family transcriptional regulator [Rhodococcus sp. NPDC003382]
MVVVRPESVYQQALEWMRTRIESGDWPVGDRIPTEAELVSILGVGRNTVREAVKYLTSAGMLEIRRGFGTYVRARSELGGLLNRRVEVAEILHAFEVRRALELEAVRLACERRTDEDIAQLREALAARARFCDGADEAGYASTDIAFHSAVVRAAHNSVLEDLFARLSELIRATYEFTHGAFDPASSTVVHEQVVDAIEARDEVRAQAAARGYLDPIVGAVHDSAASGHRGRADDGYRGRADDEYRGGTD